MPGAVRSAVKNAPPPTCPASNGSPRLVLMRWSACWEREGVACSMPGAKNLSRGWSRPRDKPEKEESDAVQKSSSDSGDESACVGSDWLSGDGSGPVSPGGHHRLACRLDLPDPALRLLACWHLATSKGQPCLA